MNLDVALTEQTVLNKLEKEEIGDWFIQIYVSPTSLNWLSTMNLSNQN